MAGGMATGRLAKTVFRYGMKYGPLVFEAVKHGREPAQRAVRESLARQACRRRAHRHAATLLDGSVLQVFRDGEPIWIAFSGETPVAAYPAVDVPLATLLEYADLSRREPPKAAGRPGLPARRRRPGPREIRELGRRLLRAPRGRRR